MSRAQTAGPYAQSSAPWGAAFGVLVGLTFGVVPARADTETRVTNYVFPIYSASNPTTALVQSEILDPGDQYSSLQTSFTYGTEGNRIGTSVVGSYVNGTIATSTTYEPTGRFPQTSTDAVGHPTSFTYDPALGLVTSQTDPNNLKTTWTYDAWGRKTLELRPDGNQTAYAYNLCSAPLSTEPACPTLAMYIVQTTPENVSGVQNGPLTIVYYDKLDRVVRKAWQSESNFTTTVLSFQDTTYDNLGRVISTTQPYYQGQTPVLASSQTYDQANRVLKRTYADSSNESYSYSGYVTTATDTLGRTTTTYRDSHHVTKVVDPAGQPMTYAYDAFDDVTKITDPAGHVTSATYYSPRGWRLSLSDPDTGTSVYWYDALGRLISQTDADGKDTWWYYDAIGRPYIRYDVATSGAMESYDYWAYDPTNGIGKPSGMARWSYATSQYTFERWYAYDSLSRLSYVTTQTDPQSSYQGTAYTYDTNDRLSEVVRSSGLSLVYNYNARSRLVSIQDVSTGSAAIWTAQSSDAAGRITQDASDIDGVPADTQTNTRSFDANRGWLTNVTSYLSSATLINQTIGHAVNGRVTSRFDTVTGINESFSYVDANNHDFLDRLTQSSLTNVNVNVGTITKTMSYDAVGNFLNKSDVGTYSYGGTQPYAVSSIAQPSPLPALTFTYDSDGSMTSGAGRTVSYDAAEMPKTVTEGANTVNYTYDASHQRATQITPTETTRYYNLGANSDSSLQTYPSTQTRWIDYIHSPTGLIGAVYTTTPAGGGTPSATELSYTLDHISSIAATGRTERSYDSWGKQRFTLGVDDTGNALMASNAEPRGFISQEQVPAITLVNLNRRMYDPWVGRFLSADPVIGSVFNAQAMNPYSYVMNNPLTYSDPSGACGGFFCSIGSFFSHAFAGALGQDLRAIASIAVVVITEQYELAPEFAALEGPIDATELGAPIYATSLSQLPTAFQAADVAIAGAIGGAINTGSLRGTLIGTATAEAFWGVGGMKGMLGTALNTSSYTSGESAAIVSAAGIALHAAVGCVSSAAGGGRCGSGAISGGLGELTGSIAPSVSNNPFVQSAVAGLGGGAGSALTGGRFGDGFFLAASGYLFSGGGGDSGGPTMQQGTGGTAFVGGFFDYTIGGPAYQDYEAYIATPGNSAAYFTWDQGGALGSWIDANGGAVSVIGHSYGGDTAASVVGAGHSVASLTTVDPVSWFRPSYSAVAANAGTWTNFNATGGAGSIPNIIAGVGGAWGNGPLGYATRFQNIPLNHAGIMFRCGLPGSC